MIQTICVCGAGTMGSGIAQVAASAGFNTLLYDLDPVMLQKGKASIENSLQISVEKNKLTAADRQHILDRIRFVTDPAGCVADLIIEAIIEKIEAKVALFEKLISFNGKNTILATNTSSLSVTELADKVSHPERMIGIHFFNPAPLMKLVEVVNTPLTSPQVTEQVTEITRQMGKTPVICKDAPGFIVNHVARPYYLEALKLLEMGVTDPSTIDRVMEASGFKMGPFRLMDLIGNDINYAVSCSVYDAMGRPERLKPSFIQEEKVKNGELGRKSGKGYYSYP